MYARVTFCTGQLDKIDEASKIIRDSVIPAFKKQKGSQKYLFLTDRASGKVMAISLWNTEADMKSGESEYHQKQFTKVAPFATGPATTEFYEVTVQG